MEDQASPIEKLFEKTEHYARTSVELYRLKVIEKSADIVSTLVANLAVILFLTLCFLIMNIGLALWIGEMFGKSYYGFFIVSGFYAVAGTLLYIFRRQWIKTPLQNSIITIALN